MKKEYMRCFLSKVPKLKVNTGLNYWLNLLGYCVSTARTALRNPNFVFSFLIIMIISSAGIWAPYLYDLNLSPACAFHQSEIQSSERSVPYKSEADGNLVAGHPDVPQAMEIACVHAGKMKKELLQGFSVFMFSLGILGGIAFEFFVTLRERVEEENNKPVEQLNSIKTREFAGFFLWIMAILFSSYGLKEPTVTSHNAIIGSCLAIFLWVCVNHNKAPFKQKPLDPNNIEAGGKEVNHDLTGEGLS